MFKLPEHPHKIAVSGAAAGEDVIAAQDLARTVGREIALEKCILLTGATTGSPYFAAEGSKQAGGFVIGFSPASSQREHEHKFKLPVDQHDIIFYSSFGYAHRNTLLTTLSDAVIVVCGRIGTLNEFTTTFEENKIIGVLLGSGGMADEIPHIIEVAKRGSGHIVYDSDPEQLVKKVIHLIAKADK
jgi:uncharacterized protein (TIGR00725 family)